MNKTVLAILMLACLTGTQSCKKGCTDPKAINYVAGAKQDNATCLYCDSTVSPGNTGSAQFEDLNQSSQYNNQIVLFVEIIPSSVTYYGNACQQLGLGVNGNSNCTPSNMSAIFINETNSNMVTSGTLIIPLSSNNFVYNISSLAIPALGRDTINIGRACIESFFNVGYENPTYQYY